MSHRTLWFISLTLSLLFVAGTGFIWHGEVATYESDPQQLLNQAQVDAVMEACVKMHPDQAGFLTIPTGVFIQSLEFVSASDVNFTGYVWQRYAMDLPPTVTRGLVFPDEIESAMTWTREAYRRRDGDVEVIGWYFDVTVRQPFDYSRYPLDRHDVWLRLWHADFDKNIILTPDFNAYRSTAKGEAFGLDQKIVSGLWQINETFFGYQHADYDTNFGIPDYVGQEHFPELHFNVVVSRRFLNAFIVNLIPLFIVAILLMSILLTTTADKEKAETFGFSTSGAIGAASALFFVVMLGHIQLRETLTDAPIVYIEQYYFVIYVAILMVALNVYLFTSGNQRGVFRVLTYEHNLIPKLIYFPAITASLFAITVRYF
ncbi:hypothetical protein [Synoicihabitans lomoniglobus]|uniref:Neurotransmitter-gated ion-channel ligand-binding domain-containing protein n=1 Tax=Synoicihabitans lomoniglobus TaxID=2909285 RepID=A0AAE9ZUR4_9BACT|nr:hypothetical protein [Opitutaceae bacterium LMO-M01]WED64467.1 hypothetical protein PXH66_19175 [Opitutaceae bacterium LMO-M01]